MASLERTSASLTSSIRLNNSLAVASMSLLYYDYFLTLSMEVEYFWRCARLSSASILFLLNRYLGLLGPIPIMVEYFGKVTPQVMISTRSLSGRNTDNPLEQRFVFDSIL
ncbi:hypothetical protein BD413DRAFT_11745 [Trametes elegans]|nr:hypothetical protein BD413DRAFT_11745 [Trametes elegans]